MYRVITEAITWRAYRPNKPNEKCGKCPPTKL